MAGGLGDASCGWGFQAAERELAEFLQLKAARRCLTEAERQKARVSELLAYEPGSAYNCVYGIQRECGISLPAGHSEADLWHRLAALGKFQRNSLCPGNRIAQHAGATAPILYTTHNAGANNMHARARLGIGAAQLGIVMDTA